MQPASFATFNRILAEAVEKDVPLPKAFGHLVESFPPGRTRNLMRGVQGALRDGEPLPAALRCFPGDFPGPYCALVETAQGAGRLPRILRDVAEEAVMRHRVHLKGRWLLVYVIVSVLAVASVLTAYLHFSAAGWKNMYEELHVSLPLVTEWVLGMAPFGRFILPAAILFCILIWTVSTRGWVLPVVSRACDFLPIWGRLKRARDLAYFCSALASSLEAGVPLPESLDRSRGAVAGRALARRLAQVAREVREGATLSGSLQRARGIPRTLAWAVSLGERRGAVPEVVRSFVDLYRREVESRYEAMRALANPVGILVITHFIGGFVVLPLFLPLIIIMDALGVG